MKDRYHHGQLRESLLDEARLMLDEMEPGAVSLRELARRVGVSHAAPAHHFGDKRGLLTAVASQSLQMLAEDVRTATAKGFDEAAVAYVRFAHSCPGRYAVMHDAALLDAEDGELIRARKAATAALVAGVESIPPQRRAGLTVAEAAHVAWCLVHGLASVPASPTAELTRDDDLVRRAARQLYG